MRKYVKFSFASEVTFYTVEGSTEFSTNLGEKQRGYEFSLVADSAWYITCVKSKLIYANTT